MNSAIYDKEGKYKVDFALTVQGEYMKDEGIHNGDVVFCRRAAHIPSGKIAAVRIDGGPVTFRRVYHYDDGVTVLVGGPGVGVEVIPVLCRKRVEIVGLAVVKQSEIR